MRRAFVWRNYGRIVAFSVLVLTVSGVFTWGVNAIFTIRRVEVSGEGIAIAVDQTKVPKNLLFFPIEQVTRQILKEYPLVGSVVMKKKYPSTLLITAVPRKPFTVVGVGGEIYAVDADGVVLSQYPNLTNMPFIRIAAAPLQPGLVIADRNITAAIGFLRATAATVTVSEVTPYDGSSLQARSETMSIVFLQHADMLTLARTLQMMISGFRIKGKLPTTIDLRFDKPVVTF